MNKTELTDLLWNLMDLKLYGRSYFEDHIDIAIYRGKTTVEKSFFVTLKERSGITKNADYYRNITKIFDAFNVDFHSDNGEITFSLINLKCDNCVY